MAYYEEMTDELAERVGSLMVNTGAKSMAVSYTHLTLPTKRIV